MTENQFISKSSIEITIRCKQNETIGNIDSIKKLLKNKDLAPFYLVKVTENDQVIYIEETASKQMPIQLDGDNFRLSFNGQSLEQNVANIFEMLNADVYLGYLHNQVQ